MSDEDQPGMSSEEELLSRHRKEKKELQAEISRLKHGVPKGDKKRKKEITAEIAMIEAKLEAKHEKELSELKSGNMASQATSDMAALSIIENGTAVTCNESTQKAKKPSKAQRRREKKAAGERAREEEIAKQEIENLTGARHTELLKLKALLKERNLAIREVPSDGNCLYAAVELQLRDQGTKMSVPELRQNTAQFMRDHMDDFMPFLCKPDTGDPFTTEEFERYCRELESTSAWGGQIEINALSKVLRAPIEVIQAGSPSVVSGEEFKSARLLLTYHRHMFGLGEHYNAVGPRGDDDDDGDEAAGS